METNVNQIARSNLRQHGETVQKPENCMYLAEPVLLGWEEVEEVSERRNQRDRTIE